MSEASNKKLSGEVQERFVGYITTASGLIAGLAWNDAIKSLIEFVFPIQQNSITAKFIYAIVITIVVVVAANYIVKLLKKES